MTSKMPALPGEAATSPIATVAVTFPKFPRLPLELRLIIWHFGLPGPRIIRVKLPEPAQYQKVRGQNPGISRRSLLECNTKVPAMLHTCQESREVALKMYSIAFRGAFYNRGPIYFDFDRDTIYTSHARTLGILEKNCRRAESDNDRRDVTKRLQHVMLECRAGRVVGETLAKVEGLKTVTMQLNATKNILQAVGETLELEHVYCRQTRKRDKDAWEKLKIEYLPQHKITRLHLTNKDGFPKHAKPLSLSRPKFVNPALSVGNRLAHQGFEREI